VSKKTRQITDPQVLRAIAQPVRLRLYEVLVSEGPSTASRLSKYVPAASGSLSYHLRQLAEHGFIEPAPECGHDSRERWWKAVPGGMRWSPAELGDSPGAREAATAAQRVLVSRHVERLQHWINDGPQEWDDEWQRAASSTDAILRLSAPELTQLGTELDAVLKKWGDLSRGRSDAPDDSSGSAQVFVMLHAFPFAHMATSASGQAASPRLDARQGAATGLAPQPPAVSGDEL
jgi:DNA-binding transcriptional ArsR family regulator